MTHRQLLQYKIKRVAPFVFVIILIYTVLAIFIHPFIVFLLFLIFTVLIFHTIDNNTAVLEARIKRLEYKIRTLELKVSEDFQTRKI